MDTGDLSIKALEELKNWAELKIAERVKASGEHQEDAPAEEAAPGDPAEDMTDPADAGEAGMDDMAEHMDEKRPTTIAAIDFSTVRPKAKMPMMPEKKNLEPVGKKRFGRG
jgi:hypothetical protein